MHKASSSFRVARTHFVYLFGDIHTKCPGPSSVLVLHVAWNASVAYVSEYVRVPDFKHDFPVSVDAG